MMITNLMLLENLCISLEIKLTEHFKSYILQKLQREPFPHTRSEQDKFELARKMVMAFKNGDQSCRLLTDEELLREERAMLQSLFYETHDEVRALRDYIYELELLLKHNEIDLPDTNIEF